MTHIEQIYKKNSIESRIKNTKPIYYLHIPAEKCCVLIRSTFNETNNISAASRKLGVSRTTIYKHLQ